MRFRRRCDRHSIDLVKQISPIRETFTAMRCGNRRCGFRIRIANTDHFHSAFGGKLCVIAGMVPAETSHAYHGDLRNAECGMRNAELFHNLKLNEVTASTILIILR